MKLFDYQIEFIRSSGMCPRKLDKSLGLCGGTECLECKEEAKKAAFEDARAMWLGEPTIPKGEMFEKELQNEIPDDGVPIELKKYEPLFHLNPEDLIEDCKLTPEQIDKCYQNMSKEIQKKIYGF